MAKGEAAAQKPQARGLTTPTITAVLTTYRRPERAQRALRSILAQTLPPTEIVVVEDGSTSKGLTDLVEQVAHRGVKYVRHEKNRGLAAARNTGLGLSTGEYVAYLDDDDEWLPNRLERQVAKLFSMPESARAEVAAIQVGCQVVDGYGRCIGVNLPVNQGSLRQSIMTYGAVTPSSSFLFLRTALLNVGGFDEHLVSGIDHDIWMQLAVGGYASEIVPEPLVIVHRSEGRTMMSSSAQRIEGVRQYVEKWTPTFEKWFGRQAGRLYGRRYFIDVLARLAAQKLTRLELRSTAHVLGAVRRAATEQPTQIGFAIKCVGWRLLAGLKSRLAVQVRDLMRKRHAGAR